MRSLVVAWCAVALCTLVVVSSVAAHSMVHPLSKVRVDHIQRATRTGPHAATGSITINAQQFSGMMDQATVTWSNVASVYPGDSDWIGVWSPKPSDYTKTTPAKYKFVTPDENGSGQTTFNFLNMRDSYVVAYFTGGLDNPTLLAESAPVQFDNYHMPQQIHLAYTKDPTEMVIQWTTLQNSFPSVNYGLTSTHLNNTLLRVRTSSYKATDMCGAPATTIGFHEPGQLHVALLTGLEPNTQYWYQLGDESTNSRSDVLNFWTAPVPGAQTPVDFIIFGDLGQVELDGSNEASMMDGSILTTVAMAKDFEDGTIQTNLSAAVFHIGDISYARGYATMWEQFFYQISAMSPYVPWMTTDGNHERDFPNSGSVFNGSDSGGECGVSYEHRFHMPTDAPDETWYSLNYGPVHFIVMSTEHDFAVDSKQYAWIEADLKAVNRSVTPFILLTGHRPMYLDANADGGDYSVSLLMQQVYEPLMQKYQVDLGVWGHHHSAQRTCPVFQGECVPANAPVRGTVHLVTGASGAGFSTNILRQAPSWIEYVEDNIHGYSRVRVRGNTMTIDFVDSRTRTVIDTVTLQSQFPANKHTRTHAHSDEKEENLMARVEADQIIDRLNAIKEQ